MDLRRAFPTLTAIAQHGETFIGSNIVCCFILLSSYIFFALFVINDVDVHHVKRFLFLFSSKL